VLISKYKSQAETCIAKLILKQLLVYLLPTAARRETGGHLLVELLFLQYARNIT